MQLPMVTAFPTRGQFTPEFTNIWLSKMSERI